MSEGRLEILDLLSGEWIRDSPTWTVVWELSVFSAEHCDSG